MKKKENNIESKEVQKLVEDTIDYFNRYETMKDAPFVNELNELIVIPKINAYFCLNNVKTALDFKCKVINYLSFYTASNHWCKRWSIMMCRYINHILKTDFASEQFDEIYSMLGNGIRPELTVRFVKSEYDFNILLLDNSGILW